MLEIARRVKRLIVRPEPEIREREIPPQEINFNSSGGGDYAEYARLYKALACLVEIPFLTKKAGLTRNSSILDYGCGLGRFAYAASKFLSSSGSYYGYEPNQTALTFLKSAYADRKNIHFAGEELSFEEDYVAKVQNKKPSNSTHALDVDLTGLVNSPVDIQWSTSVFTHMWQEPITHVLSNFKKVVKPTGLCINTWLMIDDHAEFVLRCGLADRVLPLCINDAYTYSKDNPLVCTAYKAEKIEEIYDRAGHEIVEIIKGTWAGNAPSTWPFYQDVVISKFK